MHTKRCIVVANWRCVGEKGMVKFYVKFHNTKWKISPHYHVNLFFALFYSIYNHCIKMYLFSTRTMHPPSQRKAAKKLMDSTWISHVMQSIYKEKGKEIKIYSRITSNEVISLKKKIKFHKKIKKEETSLKQFSCCLLNKERKYYGARVWGILIN